MRSVGITLALNNRVALISGGSRGIGAAAVRMFAQAGARVAFSYQKAKSDAEKLVQLCGGQECCVAIQANLDSASSAKKLVEAAVKKFGRLDILVANHGVWPANDESINEMTEEQWRRTMAINLDSVFGLIKYSVAQMKKQKVGAGDANAQRVSESATKAAGHIVLISSTAGQRVEAFHCDYAASKGALISMVKGLSTELAPDGIYVNCVAPGWVRTNMSEPALSDPPVAKRVLATIPLGRVGSPEEIAAPILFLCTQHAGFITGEIFNVNGGAVLVG